MVKQTQLLSARQLAEDLILQALNDLDDWHTRETEVFGRAPLSDSEQTQVNTEITKLRLKIRKLLKR